MDESANRPAPPEPRYVLAALVRRAGRVRVTARELGEVRKGSLTMGVTEQGDIVVTWVET